MITILNQANPVTDISVSAAGGATSITTNKGSLQLYANVLPSIASNKMVNWSIQNITGQATISSNGLVTASVNGTVTATATAADGSGIYGSLNLAITGQTVSVTQITLSSENDANTITNDKGTLQLKATIAPVDATNKALSWTIQNGTGQATINSTGLVTAISNGTVTATAKAADGSVVSGSLTITITNQIILANDIIVIGEGGATTITEENGTMQLAAVVNPGNATNTSIIWSIVNGTGQASINNNGVVTALADGIVTVVASLNDGSNISGSLNLTINSGIEPVNSIVVYGADNATSISRPGESLQLSASVFPANASNTRLTWSVENGTGSATINESGLLIAVSEGTVTVRANSTDGSGISGMLNIQIGTGFISNLDDANKDKAYLVANHSNLLINILPDTNINQVSLFSITGELISTREITESSCQMDISFLPAAIYLIFLKSDDGSYSSLKFFKP